MVEVCKKASLKPLHAAVAKNYVLELCLTYTLKYRLGTSWKQAGELLVNNSHFLTCQTKMDAVNVSITVSSEEITFRVRPYAVKLPQPDLESFGICSDALDRFASDASYVIPETTISCGWCHILPSMKKGQIVGIARKLELVNSCDANSSSLLKDYPGMRKYWKLHYGYVLPESDADAVFCNIYFRRIPQHTFTYPLLCVRPRSFHFIPRCDEQGIAQRFMGAVREKFEKICGIPIAYSARPAHTTINLSSALEIKPGALCNVEDVKLNQQQKKIPDVQRVPLKTDSNVIVSSQKPCKHRQVPKSTDVIPPSQTKTPEQHVPSSSSSNLETALSQLPKTSTGKYIPTFGGRKPPATSVDRHVPSFNSARSKKIASVASAGRTTSNQRPPLANVTNQASSTETSNANEATTSSSMVPSCPRAVPCFNTSSSKQMNSGKASHVGRAAPKSTQKSASKSAPKSTSKSAPKSAPKSTRKPTSKCPPTLLPGSIPGSAPKLAPLQSVPNPTSRPSQKSPSMPVQKAAKKSAAKPAQNLAQISTPSTAIVVGSKAKKRSSIFDDDDDEFEDPCGNQELATSKRKISRNVSKSTPHNVNNTENHALGSSGSTVMSAASKKKHSFDEMFAATGTGLYTNPHNTKNSGKIPQKHKFDSIFASASNFKKVDAASSATEATALHSNREPEASFLTNQSKIAKKHKFDDIFASASNHHHTNDASNPSEVIPSLCSNQSEEGASNPIDFRRLSKSSDSISLGAKKKHRFDELFSTAASSGASSKNSTPNLPNLPQKHRFNEMFCRASNSKVGNETVGSASVRKPHKFDQPFSSAASK